MTIIDDVKEEIESRYFVPASDIIPLDDVKTEFTFPRNYFKDTCSNLSESDWGDEIECYDTITVEEERVKGRDGVLLNYDVDCFIDVPLRVEKIPQDIHRISKRVSDFEQMYREGNEEHPITCEFLNKEEYYDTLQGKTAEEFLGLYLRCKYPEFKMRHKLMTKKYRVYLDGKKAYDGKYSGKSADEFLDGIEGYIDDATSFIITQAECDISGHPDNNRRLPDIVPKKSRSVGKSPSGKGGLTWGDVGKMYVVSEFFKGLGQIFSSARR